MYFYFAVMKPNNYLDIAKSCLRAQQNFCQCAVKEPCGMHIFNHLLRESPPFRVHTSFKLTINSRLTSLQKHQFLQTHQHLNLYRIVRTRVYFSEFFTKYYSNWTIAKENSSVLFCVRRTQIGPKQTF